MEIILQSEKRLHKEKHYHHCMIHSRGKCRHEYVVDSCNNCVFLEDNEVCQKTLRGTGMESHQFPCMNCMTMWRGQYGGETMIDAFIDLEQAGRLAHVAPDKRLDERESLEGEDNVEVEEFNRAKRRV